MTKNFVAAFLCGVRFERKRVLRPVSVCECVPGDANSNRQQSVASIGTSCRKREIQLRKIDRFIMVNTKTTQEQANSRQKDRYVEIKNGNRHQANRVVRKMTQIEEHSRKENECGKRQGKILPRVAYLITIMPLHITYHTI